LVKLTDGMHAFKESHLEEDVIAKKEKVLKKVRALSEVNPMLGHRGVRLGITYPEIYCMQIQAILEAAALCAKEGVQVYPEIMVPQVATVEELRRIQEHVQRLHKVVELTHGINVRYKFGSMLEVVRACMRAHRMAEIAEFFSFGTNDLTQATFSFSREDAENKFLPAYNESGILQDNPFEVSRRQGRRRGPDEDGGGAGPADQPGTEDRHLRRARRQHPASIHFCHHIGLRLRLLLRSARAHRATGGGAGETAGRAVHRPELSGPAYFGPGASRLSCLACTLSFTNCTEITVLPSRQVAMPPDSPPMLTLLVSVGSPSRATTSFCVMPFWMRSKFSARDLRAAGGKQQGEDGKDESGASCGLLIWRTGGPDR
jgi:hypothetical protein